MRKTKILLALVLVVLGSLSVIKFTRSYFSDTEKVLGNSIQVGVWGESSPEPTPTSEIPPSEPTPTPTPTPESSVPTVTPTSTPTPTPTPTQIIPGDVVINELMWSGSLSNQDDEWIELRNTRGYPVDLSDWQLTRLVGASNTETLMLTIPLEKAIPANGYFLISRFDKTNSIIDIDPDVIDSSVVLRNDDLQIKLYKGSWTQTENLMDVADDGNGLPFAGNNSTKKSMERNTSVGDGSVVGNWHTAASQSNLDSGATEMATPKAMNGPP